MVPRSNLSAGLVAAVLLLLGLSSSNAFTATTGSLVGRRSRTARVLLFGGATVAEPPTREKTDRKTGQEEDDGFVDDDYPDLEYLIDSAESREMKDPFHILLLGSTFEKPKVTVSYCAGSLEYVLAMPRAEAMEQSKFAQQEGLSCLGTWPRVDALTLGRQLQIRDLECRVVPFAEGGHRGWQAKDASTSNSNNAQN